MWEIFERGAAPFYWMNNEQAREAVENGERCAKPDDCPSEVYKVMLKCWNIDPEKRPSFLDILKELQSIYSQLGGGDVGTR